ncbi:DoxX family protein [Paenibacillus montanisoli]|uniref:Crp/Fnr family transcriptional regulator n=1 Tax=Paenibacillus montanisoli TaxID=2081970 RepID=A0A328U310_9BACL|nr:DoxX family protein [Paenibacillus montanisoli]RAP75801.1 Crp/Fnr family transcriptional regulator [Paenibacillus montanisoli]
MVMRWFKQNVWAAVLVTLARIYIGWQWLDAGWHKMTGGFDATGFLKGAVEKPVIDRATQEAVYPNFVNFLDHFAIPNVKLINFLIPLGEFLIGVGLIVGGLTLAATFFGMMLNFMFLFAGTVSTNPWLLLIAMIVFTAGANAGKFGLDYYLIPLIRKGWKRLMAAMRKEGKTHANIDGRTLPR